MLKITVLYGHPKDPNAFDQYYTETHTPIALKIPNLKGLTIGRPAAIDPNEKSPYHLIANLYFDSMEAFQSAMGAPDGQAAVADVQNFATGGATMLLDEEQILIPISLAK